MSEHPSSESSLVANVSGLTPAQLEELRERLLRARAETLMRLLGEQSTARSSDSLPEPMDAAELAREQGDGATLSERSRALLREIDAALSRLETGRYGTSERSGELIGFERLRAVPWARLTVDEEEE